MYGYHANGRLRYQRESWQIRPVLVWFLVLTCPVLTTGWQPPHGVLDFDGRETFVETAVNAGDLGVAGAAPRTVEAWVNASDFNYNAVFSLGTRGESRRDLSRFATDTTDRWCFVSWADDQAGLAPASRGGQDASPSYGCEANPTGDPIGGGAGYRDIHATGDFTVTSRGELVAALEQAKPGQIVFVPSGTEIDLTDQATLSIPPGVTLAGTRGKDGCRGARLFSNRFGRMFITAGDRIRLTGLRFEGAYGGTERIAGNATFLLVNHYDTRVDNCEIFNFNVSGIGVSRGALKTRIHHNYIHHCQRDGLGYGVSVHGGSDVRIVANIFDYCRHHIACTGAPGTGYEAAWNLIKENASGSHFDMHGGRDRGDATDIAGDWMHIHHNTFLNPHVHVGIRGTPSDGAEVHNNWFARPPQDAVRATGNTRVFQNAWGPEKTPQEAPFHFVDGQPVDWGEASCPWCPES